MTRVDQGQEVGLRAWGLNHCVCEEKAGIYQEWTGTEIMLCFQTSPTQQAHKYSNTQGKVITLLYSVRIVIFFIPNTEREESISNSKNKYKKNFYLIHFVLVFVMKQWMEVWNLDNKNIIMIIIHM